MAACLGASAYRQPRGEEKYTSSEDQLGKEKIYFYGFTSVTSFVVIQPAWW